MYGVLGRAGVAAKLRRRREVSGGLGDDEREVDLATGGEAGAEHE